MVTAGAQAARLVSAAEQGGPGVVQLYVAPHQSRRHLGVAPRERAAQTHALALPCSLGDRAYLRGRRDRRGVELGRRGTLHIDEEVDAVEQRSAEAPPVAVVVGVGAAAARGAAVAAGAR